ncbi:MAG TPA: DUF5655 domain-containing protein [Stellaceae bacterium]
MGVDVNGAPVIIEYKKKQNNNVINQALLYRKWLTGQKPEFFEMLILRNLSSEVASSIQLDWRHPRIVCIAESFNRFDIDTADVLSRQYRVELLTYRAYEHDMFVLEPLQITSEPQAEPSDIPDTAAQSETAAERYSVESHLSRASPAIQELFNDLRSRILALGPQVVERARQQYIGYRTSKNFAEVHIQKSSILVYLRGIIDDPKNRITKVPDSFGFVLSQRVSFDDVSDVEYVMELIGQSYNDVI